MSLTPTTPASLSENLKSFWSRPEGKTGMIFLGIGAAALIYGWGRIVPFVVSMLADTLHMVGLAAILAAVPSAPAQVPPEKAVSTMTVSDGLRTVLCGRMMLEVRRLAAELRALAAESPVP